MLMLPSKTYSKLYLYVLFPQYTVRCFGCQAGRMKVVSFKIMVAEITP